MNTTTPPPRLPSPDTQRSHHRHFVELRTRAAMHTIAAAAVWQFETSLSEANCICGGPCSAEHTERA